MKDNLAAQRSSYLVSWPVLLVSTLLCVLAAFFDQQSLAGILMFLAVMSGGARLWAFSTARGIQLRITGGNKGLFPGEHTQVELVVQNQKFLPVVWLELVFPLARDLCLTPERPRKPEDWECSVLEGEGASTQLIGEQRLSFLLWYESRRLSVGWTANRRGVYSMKGWRFRTGDGFGLTQIERKLPQESVRTFYVYPKLIPVSPDLFLRSLWNADTGNRGVMEDPTVIRSTRDYMTIDSLKHINWRLTARGLPMTVNVYEDILPKGVHFLLDGESFSGPEPHLAELEEALSILASELVQLEQVQVPCGLSICKGSSGAGENHFSSANTEELLCSLASYQLLEPKRDDDGKIQMQPTVFDEGPILEQAQRVGRFYYLAYDRTALSRSTLLNRLGDSITSVLTYQNAEPYGEFEVVCLRHLKEETGHG